jgi:hypothetical protein
MEARSLEEPQSLLQSAMQCRRIVDCEDGHPRGWPLLLWSLFPCRDLCQCATSATHPPREIPTTTYQCITALSVRMSMQGVITPLREFCTLSSHDHQRISITNTAGFNNLPRVGDYFSGGRPQCFSIRAIRFSSALWA